jgi:hypothetical protein
MGRIINNTPYREIADIFESHRVIARKAPVLRGDLAGAVLKLPRRIS